MVEYMISKTLHEEQYWRIRQQLLVEDLLHARAKLEKPRPKRIHRVLMLQLRRAFAG
jgi:hypothetical protein